MHFVYQPLSGDGTIVAQVARQPWISSASGSDDPRNAKRKRKQRICGIPRERHLLSDRSSTGGLKPIRRVMKQRHAPVLGNVSPQPEHIQRLSVFGRVNWVPVGTPQSITMNTNAFVGLAVCGYTSSGTGLATATFRNVSVSSDGNPGPIISSLSASTGPIGTQLFIYGSGFGATQGNSVITLNGTAVTVNSWIDTSISVTIPSGATSGLFTVSVAPAMNASNGVPFTITSQPLPTGWLDQDIGSVGPAGSATYASGVFTVTGREPASLATPTECISPISRCREMDRLSLGS